MSMRKPKNKLEQELWCYLGTTCGILIMVVGIYFFKFPNNFAFGGVTGFSSVVSALTGITTSRFTFWANMILLAVGFLFLGAGVGLRTVYASVLMSLALSFLEKLVPMDGTLTQEPLLELVFAILLPAIGSAILFHVGSSSGGTDILAMILRKYSSVDIGTALLIVDLAAVLSAFCIFGPATGLYSILGLFAKAFVVDGIMDNLNRCKSFNIVCKNPDPICNFIIQELHRGATVYEARGAFSHENKTVIMTAMKRSQAIRLRKYIRTQEPGAFIQVYNSSEIMGNGFLSV